MSESPRLKLELESVRTAAQWQPCYTASTLRNNQVTARPSERLSGMHCSLVADVLADEWRENREINAGEYSGRWSTLCGSSKSHMHVCDS